MMAAFSERNLSIRASVPGMSMSLMRLNAVGTLEQFSDTITVQLAYVFDFFEVVIV